MNRAEIVKNSKSLTERAEASTNLGLRVKKRVRAAVFDILGEAMKDPNWRRTLAAQAAEDPMRFLERVDALMPKDAEPAAAGPAVNLNLAFLNAVRGAQEQPPAIESTPLPVLELEARQAEPETPDW